MQTETKNGLTMAKRKNFSSKLRLIWMVSSVLMIIAGAIGLIFIQRPLGEPQLMEPEALMVDDGQVELGYELAADLKAGKENTLYLTINTHGNSVYDLAVIFSFESKVIPSLKARAFGLPSPKMELDSTSKGFLVYTADQSTDDPLISSTEFVKFIELKFTPSKAGDLTINFDQDLSSAETAATTPAPESLKRLASLDFKIFDNGTGGSSYAGCNDNCDSNGDCSLGLYCYDVNDNDSYCRRPGNPTNTSCEAKPDEGLDFACNEYCADTSECDSAYLCYNNRCRLEENVDDEYCREPNQTTITNQSNLCNQSCTSEDDCAINLTCYQGECRLKTNPSSSSCSTLTKKIVHRTVYKTVPSTTTTVKQKGDVVKLPDTIASDEAEASTEATVIEEVNIPYTAPVADTENEPVAETPKENALSAIINNLKDRGVTLSIILIAAGAVLFIITLLISILKRGPKPPTPPQGGMPAQPSEKTQAAIGNLEDRIKTLQQNQVGKNQAEQQPPAKPGVLTSASQAPVPTALMPQADGSMPTESDQPGARSGPSTSVNQIRPEDMVSGPSQTTQ